MDRIYFDYAATTPTDPDVIQAMAPYWFGHFGNASSPHSFGREASKALEDARSAMARFIGAKPSEIILTSGATESNNYALKGFARKNKSKGNHIIISAVEHHSVREPANELAQEGFEVTLLDVDEHGCLSPADVQKAVTDQTILVAVMHASNEIGTIQPIQDISKITKSKGIPLLVDAVQTVGHLPVQVDELGADFLSFSAHKFYGPKGIGALYVREGHVLQSLLTGGDQEKGRRASTQNVVGAVGMARACELCAEKMEEEIKVQSQFRDRFLSEIPKMIDGVKVNGHLTHRLPNNAHFSFEGVQSESLLMSLDMDFIAASMGSACTSGAMQASDVLRAIGLDDNMAMGSLRISMGRWTTEDHIDKLLNDLPVIIKRLRAA